MLSAPMPPTGISGVPFGSTASIALTTAGDASSAGNSFSPCAPAPKRSERLRGRHDAGRAFAKAEPYRLDHDVAIEVRRHDQLAAG